MIVARMALVPRTLEARGLDATPLIQEKLRRVGTPAARRAVDILDILDILDIILRDEIGHGWQGRAIPTGRWGNKSPTLQIFFFLFRVLRDSFAPFAYGSFSGFRRSRRTA